MSGDINVKSEKGCSSSMLVGWLVGIFAAGQCVFACTAYISKIVSPPLVAKSQTIIYPGDTLRIRIGV